ncbi:MAG: hypothetical protein Q7V16_08655, partial [Hydrogenophaga sp.]|nr:hypothetical protein [Hydrogenophaga sp.]
MASPLEDLDELVLRCRDHKAKQYISEAVASYKAGAHRASIVATWIAVCFDVIEKIRELALAGDKEAEQQVQELERTRREGDLTRALKFERELLFNARDKFELISPLECIDLERLQADRNRCAHPSLTVDDQAYSPSAELARLHIHSAVTHVLQHPPVQGKFALERVVKEVESEYFPTSLKDALVALGSGPLRRPRESLVRNLVLVVVKKILQGELTPKQLSRYRAALQATHQMHPQSYALALPDRLSALYRAMPDTKLAKCISAARAIPDCWNFLDPDVRHRIELFVVNMPSEDFKDSSVYFLLDYPPLKEPVRRRIRKATKAELVACVFFDSPPEVIDRWIELYIASGSFEEAN